MDIISPAFGLIFWMTLTFLIVFFTLKKFAWGPILGALKDREKTIQDALDSAEKAKQDMLQLQSNNEKILMEARAERDTMLKEAREIKESMINEAKGKAHKEAEKLLKDAREAIQGEKAAALTELKNQVASLSIEIAERILKSELSSDDKQKALVNTMLKEVSLN